MMELAYIPAGWVLGLAIDGTDTATVLMAYSLPWWAGGLAWAMATGLAG